MRLVSRFLGTAALVAALMGGVESAHAQQALYDTTGATFTGTALTNGGATSTITRLIADELTYTSPILVDVTQVKFTIVNLNATAPTFRPRLRFWFDNAGVPGAYYNQSTPVANVGFSFNPVSVAANSATTFTGNLGAGSFQLLAGTNKIWYGITFDNAGGSTATTAELNNLGVGIFTGNVAGSSGTSVFTTTNPGSFFTTANPVGAITNLAAGQNLGLGLFGFVPEPGTLALLCLGGVGLMFRVRGVGARKRA